VPLLLIGASVNPCIAGEIELLGTVDALSLGAPTRGLHVATSLNLRCQRR